MQKVVLVGYMGSGKSIIGKKLSEKINLPFLDLDEIIEVNENNTIKSIFENKGEIYFRKQEHLIFKELIDSDNNFVLSLGGGTPCYANNHEFLNDKNVNSIYLKASVETLYDRLALEKSKRPIISNKSEADLKEFIAKHLFDRSFYYNQSQYKIDVNNKSIDEIVYEISNLLT